MFKYIHITIDDETGENIEREMTAEEIAELPKQGPLHETPTAD